MNNCPFCKHKLPKHHAQCFHSGIPSADSIRDRDAKSRIKDYKKLVGGIVDQNKTVIDGGGNDLREKLKNKGVKK